MIFKHTLSKAFTFITAIAMVFIAGCDKTESPTSPSTTAEALVASPASISVLVGSTGFITISSGKTPYSVKSNSDTTKVRTAITGTRLSVTGLAVGTATIVVKDSAGTSTVSVPVTVATMIATPNAVSVVSGSNTSVVLSGGTLPYSTMTPPNTSVATVSISGSTVTVTGVAAGATSVTIKDNSATPKTVTIPITVTASGGGGGGTFTTAGTLAFSSNVANFSANGIFDEASMTGSGAGGFRSDTTGQYQLVIFGYKFNSATSVDLTVLVFFDVTPISAATYGYPPTTSKFVMVSYAPAMNPNSTTSDMYILSTSATASISTLTTSSAVGSFSGSGMLSSNGTPNPAKTITVTNGTFNVPVIAGSGPAQADSRIEAIVKRMVKAKYH